VRRSPLRVARGSQPRHPKRQEKRAKTQLHMNRTVQGSNSTSADEGNRVLNEMVPAMPTFLAKYASANWLTFQVCVEKTRTREPNYELQAQFHFKSLGPRGRRAQRHTQSRQGLICSVSLNGRSCPELLGRPGPGAALLPEGSRVFVKSRLAR
jgi:hypothetical protein